MLDIGLTELLCFAVIALLVLGPEKLPEAARFLAKWYGKIKKFVTNVQTEIDRELHLSEFREEMQKEIHKVTELEKRLQQQLDIMHQHSAAVSSTIPTKIWQYQYIQHCYFTPFSQAHIQNHWVNLMCQLEIKTTPIQLKIAV